MLDLRSFKNGQLKMFIDFNRELLPLNPKTDDCIVDGFACFLAGDVRVNQHITLVAIHLLFAREHNRIAQALHQLNPHWDDDLLFEESRRIVVAEIQHITYNEWLPLIIGREAMLRFSLFSRSNEYSSDYDEEINPSMTNEFTGAAFRFGHSTVQGKLFVEFEHRLEEVIALSDTFNNPARFRFKHFYDEIVRTLVHEPMQSADNAVTVGVRKANNLKKECDEILYFINILALTLSISCRKPIWT
jgi:peroxidase